MAGTWRWALAGAALAGLLGGPAAAQGLMGSTWYIKGFGGATFPQDDDFELNDPIGSFDTGLEYDTGYILGFAAGVDVTPNVAVELEYAYRNADAELKDSGGDSGKTESNAFMVNALYKFTPLGATGQWTPYVGGGLGAADLNIEDFDLAGGDLDSDYNFAYQVIGGVGFAVNPNLSLIGELRFFGINDQDLESDDVSLKSTYHTIDLLVGATYSF
jgi:opacity protein-like surface antigen